MPGEFCRQEAGGAACDDRSKERRQQRKQTHIHCLLGKCYDFPLWAKWTPQKVARLKSPYKVPPKSISRVKETPAGDLNLGGREDAEPKRDAMQTE